MMNFAQIGAMSGFTHAAASNLDADVQAWVNQLSIDGATIPSATVQNAVSDLATTWKANGLWARMKTGYILHAGDTTVGRRNLKDPSTYRTTISGTLTFSEGNGTKSNGTSYIEQPFKSNEFAGIETNLSCVQYISESSTAFGFMAAHGFQTRGGQYFFYYPLKTATQAEAGNYSAGRVTVASSNHKGLYIHTSDGTNGIIYKDGVKSTTLAPAAAPTTSQNRLILALNNHASTGVTAIQHYTKYIAYDFLFDFINDTDELNIRTALSTYNAAVGLP